MPKPPVDRILDLLDLAETWVTIFGRLDRLADRFVSIGELRFRAEVARRKSRNSKRRLGKAFWARRARKLDERADRIERSRSATAGLIVDDGDDAEGEA